MKRKRLITLGLLVALVLVAVSIAWAMSSPSFNLISDTAEGGGTGGGLSTSAGFRLEGSFGGGIRVASGSSSFQLCSGFACSAIPYPRLYLPVILKN